MPLPNPPAAQPPSLPMPNERDPGPIGAFPPNQQVVDAEHLRLLSIFHYVLGGFAFFFGSIFIIHIVIGLVVLSHPDFIDSPAPRHAVSATDSRTGSPVNYEAAPAHDSALPAFRPMRNPPMPFGGPAMPFGGRTFGYLFLGGGIFAVVLGWSFAVVAIYSGRCIASRRRRTFSLVIAGVSCLQIPLGVALGVFTFIVLQRPSVVALYTAPGAGK